jgi:predicted DNA repair protein MutK
MILGGTFLCFEGCEKLAHKFLHPKATQEHTERHKVNVADTQVDLVAAEKSKVKGAVRTDFILSAEIIVITLGTVATAGFLTQVGVLVATSMLMTVGVYGLVAGIVKLDDIGMYLMKAPAGVAAAKPTAMQFRMGQMIVAGTPYLMKFLSIAGTAAMFLVGGGILEVKGVGGVLSVIAGMVGQAVLGLTIGVVVLALVELVKRFRGTAPQAR